LKRVFFYFKPGRIDKNFRLREGELSLLDPTTFKRDPSQLTTLFEHCQNHQVKMDFRTEEAVLESLPFIDDRFRIRKGQPDVPFHPGREVLRPSQEDGQLGFLSRYIPEFSEIEGKVHYDLYHVHPVDIHSILAVGELERLRIGLYEDDYPLLTSLTKELENPGILFLTALLHDIGKGREGDHSLIGAELVERIGTRIGLSAEDRDLMVFWSAISP
jgi:[protein-PII] uridylyltransferase